MLKVISEINRNKKSLGLVVLFLAGCLTSTGCTFKGFSAPMDALTGNPLATTAAEEETTPVSTESYSVAVFDSLGRSKVVKKTVFAIDSSIGSFGKRRPNETFYRYGSDSRSS